MDKIGIWEVGNIKSKVTNLNSIGVPEIKHWDWDPDYLFIHLFSCMYIFIHHFEPYSIKISIT